MLTRVICFFILAFPILSSAEVPDLQILQKKPFILNANYFSAHANPYKAELQVKKNQDNSFEISSAHSDDNVVSLDIKNITITDGNNTTREVTGDDGIRKPFSIPQATIQRGALLMHSRDKHYDLGQIVLVSYEEDGKISVIGGVKSEDSSFEVTGVERSDGDIDLTFSAPTSTNPIENPILCDTEANTIEVSSANSISSLNEIGTMSQNVREIELALENDCKYVQGKGGATQTAMYNLALMNMINFHYENQASLTFKVVYEHFYETCSSDPFQNPGYTGIADLHNAFRDYYQANVRPSHPFDAAYLTTTERWSSGSIGRATFDSLCGNLSYGVGYWSKSSILYQFAIMAHELGHILAADHDSCPLTSVGNYIMCQGNTPSTNFSAASLNSFATQMNKECTQQISSTIADTRPYFNFQGEYDPFNLVIYEGIPFSYTIPVADENNDLVSVTALNMPNWLTITPQRKIEGFLPIDCARDPASYTSEFNLLATDATGLTAAAGVRTSLSKSVFNTAGNFDPILLPPGASFYKVFGTGVTGITYSTIDSLPPSATFNTTNAEFYWKPTIDEIGLVFLGYFEANICGTSYSTYSKYVAIPSTGIPAAKRPTNPVRVFEGSSSTFPLEWVGSSDIVSVTVSVEGALPPEITKSGNNLIIAPKKDSVVPCVGQPSGGTQLQKQISVTLKATNNWNGKSHTSVMPFTIIDYPESFYFYYDDTYILAKPGEALSIDYILDVPTGVTGSLRLGSTAPAGATIDQEHKKILWTADFTGAKINSLSQKYIEMPLEYDTCGGIKKIMASVVDNTPGVIPTFTPVFTPTLSATPSASRTAIPTRVATYQYEYTVIPAATQSPESSNDEPALNELSALSDEIANAISKLKVYNLKRAILYENLQIKLTKLSEDILVKINQTDQKDKFDKSVKKAIKNFNKLKTTKKDKFTKKRSALVSLLKNLSYTLISTVK